MNDDQMMKLETIASGALEELFQRELQRVIQDIDDPNSDPEVRRQITLEVNFHPNSERSSAVVQVKAKSKLAGNRPVSSNVYFAFSTVDGQFVARVHDPQQGRLSFGPNKSGGVPRQHAPIDEEEKPQ